MYNPRKMTSYKELFETLYHPFDKIEILFEVYFYIMVLMAVGAAIATAASTLNASFHINYYFAIVVVGIIILFLTIFGAGLVRKASTIMGLIILVCAITIFATGMKFKLPEISMAMSNLDLSLLPNAILRSFTYAGFQSVVIPTMIVCGMPLMNRRSCSKSMWISFVLNAVALTLSVLMLMGWAPVFEAVENGTTIPTLTACNSMSIAGLNIIYSVALLMCLISTGVTTVFGFVGRFEKMKVLSGIKSAPVRSAVVSAFIMIISMTVALAGLTNIIKYGYGYCGYLGIAIIIIPFLTVGHYKNKKFIQEHPEFEGCSSAQSYEDVSFQQLQGE